jgi:hypothetical protein
MPSVDMIAVLKVLLNIVVEMINKTMNNRESCEVV